MNETKEKEEVREVFRKDQYWHMHKEKVKINPMMGHGASLGRGNNMRKTSAFYFQSLVVF